MSTANVPVALPASNFNVDVVVERTAANYRSAVTSAFDNVNVMTSGYAFFEAGYPGSTGGLPQNHTFVSAANAATTFTLQPYTGVNANVIVDGGSLAPAQPFAATTLALLAASANGNTPLAATVIFTDGTTYAAPAFTVNDWYTATTAALTANNRLNLADGSIDTSNPGYPRLYEYDLTLPAVDAAKLVQSVGFSNGPGGTVGLFALSANGPAATVAYANAVVVTADSAVSVDGSPVVTMGPLSIGGNTLTVAGPAGGSLSFPSVALSGNPTFAVSTGFTLNLGSVTGTGTVATTGGQVNLSATRSLSGLNVGAGGLFKLGLGNGSLSLGSLVLAGAANAWTGTLDVTNNDLILHGASLATVTNLVVQGFAGGQWLGPGGITSSAAAADAAHLLALGVILNVTPANGSSGILYTTFDGQAVSATDVLVKYTYYGDTNLDGRVTAADYTRIDAGYVQHLSGWANGDFNYDGVVDGSDYALIDNAFNRQTTAFPSVATAAARVAAVPEPATPGLAAVATAVGLAGRHVRRRRRQR